MTPSRQQLTAMILGTERAVREALLPVIAQQNNIAITTDATTHNGRSYLCVTANFISADWQMIDMCLSVHEVSKRRDHDVISTLLNDCFLMWKHKVNAIVTDGGANFLKAAVEITKANIGVDDNIRCACHGSTTVSFLQSNQCQNDMAVTINFYGKTNRANVF